MGEPALDTVTEKRSCGKHSLAGPLPGSGKPKNRWCIMNPDTRNLLTLRTLPARLSARQTADLLGFQEHDIPVLLRLGLLKPLNHPRKRDGDNRGDNSVKMFAEVEVRARRENVDWLARATRAIGDNWAKKNARRKAEGAPTGD